MSKIIFLKTKGETMVVSKPYFYSVGRGKYPVQSIEKKGSKYVVTSPDRITEIDEADVALVEYTNDSQPRSNASKRFPSDY